MKYQQFFSPPPLLLLLVMMMVLTAMALVDAAATTYTYSLSGDFPNGAINLPEFESEIEKGLYNISLIGVSLTGDVVDIVFADPISQGHQYVLGRYASNHLATSLLNRFCEDLPDSNLSLTNAMVKKGVLVSTCTAARTYTLMTATEMVDSRVYSGKFWLINDGSASATLGMAAGGTTNHNMVVLVGTTAQFLYTVTNDITGSHAYLVMRVV